MLLKFGDVFRDEALSRKDHEKKYFIVISESLNDPIFCLDKIVICLYENGQIAYFFPELKVLEIL